MKPSNLLKIETLKDEWLDKDMVILYACFSDFIRLYCKRTFV